MRDRGNDIERIKTKWLVWLQMKIFFSFFLSLVVPRDTNDLGSSAARHLIWLWTLLVILTSLNAVHLPATLATITLAKKHTFTQTPSDSNKILCYTMYYICRISNADYANTTAGQVYRYRAIPGLFQSIGSLNGCQYQPLILRAKRNMSNTLHHNMAHHHATSCSDVALWHHRKVVGSGTAGSKRCKMKLARGQMKHITFKALFPLWLATSDT